MVERKINIKHFKTLPWSTKRVTFDYIVPTITCFFCGAHIKSGDMMFHIKLAWGDGRTACEACVNHYVPLLRKERIDD